MPPSTSSNSIFVKVLKNKPLLALVVIVFAAGVFWLGHLSGHKSGYANAQSDIQNIQEEAARKAADDAAKLANPFQAVNPLEGVEANPFEKVKKVLNPFEN